MREHAMPLVSLLLALSLMTIAAAQDRPDPYRTDEEPFIGPAPTPVMEQVFWVQINRPPGPELAVTAPEGVTLLDQTRPGPNRRHTRLYFRSDRGIRDGSIAIRGAGEDITLPLRVFTYREDIEDKVRDVPQWTPEARKGGRSFYTGEIMERARENLENHPDLAEALARPTPFDEMTDEELFSYLPSWSVPRQCYGTWPCPDCGEAIYARSAFYPWRYGRAGSFKATCPLCSREFPTNDFGNDDFTSGDYPDDGWGFDLSGTGERNKYAGWVGLVNHHTMWQSTGGALKRLGERYLFLGDERAAHAAAVLLARLAYIYPGMDMRWQQVQTGYLRQGRLLVDGNWERTGLTVPAAQAYDAIFDHIDRNTELVAFLHAKDPAIQTPDDVKALIDRYLVQLFGWDWVNARLSGGNQGARERDAAYTAVCADMGPVSDQWIEKLFVRSFNSGLNRGGFDDEMLINTLTREGITLVNGFSYAYGYLSAKSGLMEILSGVESPRWKSRCNLYDERQYPKLRAEYDAWTEMLVAGHHVPCYGDHASARGQTLPQGVAGQMNVEYARAYNRWPTDTLARALHRAGRKPVSLLEPDVWGRVEEHAERIGPAPPLPSRVLDGVGFVFLESRHEAESTEERAGIALRYGYGRGHHHQDNLNVELWAHDTPLAPELGYPVWAHPMGATGHVAHHITGMIDRSPQYTGAIARGTLEMFAAAPEASFADVSAAPAGFPNRMYRRAVCLADAPDGNVYLFDILRLAGGNLRTYAFHGPAHREFASSLESGPQSEEPFALEDMSRRLQNNILEPQEAQDDGDVWADWLHDTRDVHLRLNMLGQAGRRYHTARYGKPDAPPVRFFFPEEEGEDGASEFIALWEPYTGEPFIRRMERLEVQGAPEGEEYAPVAVRVTLAGGQVDTFIYSADPALLLSVGDIEFQGQFGYWSEQDGRLRAAHLVNGARLLKGDTGIADAPPAYTGAVTAIDLVENRVTLDLDLPVGDALRGQVMFLRGGKHRTAYRIMEVLAPGNVVQLEHTGLLFRSHIEAVGDDGITVTTELEPSLEATRGFPPGYYDDALVTNEARTARYRVARVAEGKIILDRPLDAADFPADADGRRLLCIYDHGEGDEFTVPRSVFLRH